MRVLFIAPYGGLGGSENVLVNVLERLDRERFDPHVLLLEQGPLRDRPAHDLAVESLSGVISLNLGVDGKPTIPALPVADLLCALHGLSGILMALLRREQTGKGDYLDMAMYDATLAGTANILGPTLAENRQPVARHERTTGGSAFYRLYETADGRHLALGGQEMKFVRNLLGALGRPELAPL